MQNAVASVHSVASVFYEGGGFKYSALPSGALYSLYGGNASTHARGRGSQDSNTCLCSTYIYYACACMHECKNDRKKKRVHNQ
jgi:hypothetical protein